MKTAFLFPGQGAQTIGMGKDIYDKYEEAKKADEEATKEWEEATKKQQEAYEKYDKIRNK